VRPLKCATTGFDTFRIEIGKIAEHGASAQNQ
jgi:predicted SnoaL-like aldol condensation-catalyzing enzyme